MEQPPDEAPIERPVERPIERPAGPAGPDIVHATKRAVARVSRGVSNQDQRWWQERELDAGRLVLRDGVLWPGDHGGPLSP